MEKSNYTAFNFNVIENNGDGNCLFYAISSGLKLLNSKLFLEHDTLRIKLCTWAILNQHVIFSFGHSLFSLVTGDVIDTDKETYYKNYWFEYMEDKVFVENIFFFVAAAYLDVDIFLWSSPASNKLTLKESYVASNDDNNSSRRCQMHILASGNLAPSSKSGHFRLLDRYEYLYKKVNYTMKLSECSFDLRLSDFLLADMLCPKHRPNDEQPVPSLRASQREIPRRNIFTPSPIKKVTTKKVTKRKQIVASSSSSQVNSIGSPRLIEASSILTLSSNFPTVQNATVSAFNYRHKGVNGIPSSCITNFQLILFRILKSVNTCISCPDKYSINDVNCCVIALLFLPTLCIRPSGKSKSPSCINFIFNSILDSEDIISSILSYRNQFILELSNVQKKKFHATSKPTLDMNAKLPHKVASSIEDLVKAGRLGKAMDKLIHCYNTSIPVILDENGNISEKFQNAFDNLHPSGSPPLFSEAAYPSIKISTDVLKDVISNLPMKSCNGLSSWTNELLKYSCLYESSIATLESEGILNELCVLINSIFEGKGGSAKNWIVSFFFFLNKSDGGLRPIAVDDIFVRLFGRCISKVKGSFIGEKLGSAQVGVGVSGGCEYAVHSVCNWVSEIMSDPNSEIVCVKIDIANAFNSISREAIKNGILEHSPDLLSYFKWSYGETTDLVLIDGSIIGKSSSGVRQGDPLGPMFFCLGFQSALFKTQCKFPEVDFIAYLDDGFMRGNLCSTINALKFFINEIGNIGLKVKFGPNKTVLFGNRKCIDNFTDPDLPNLHMTSDGFLVLGCPVGTNNFIDRSLNNIFNEFKKHLSLLNHVDNQTAFVLLKFCVNNKWNYISRVCFPWLLSPHGHDFDACVDKMLAKFAGVPCLSNISCIIRGLPFGLGVSRIFDISKPSWVSSYLKAYFFARSNNAPSWSWIFNYGDSCLGNHINTIDMFKDIFCKINEKFSSFSFHSSATLSFTQKLLSDSVFNFLSENICYLLTDSKAKLGYFKACAHSKPLWSSWPIFKGNASNLVFNSEAFKISLKLRLLINVFPDHFQDLQCPCSKSIDPVVLGHNINDLHCFDCSLVASNRIDRHNLIYNELMRLILKYIPDSSVEAEFTIFYNNSANKKADLRIILPDNREYFIDVSICNSGAKSYQAKDILNLLSEREKAKMNQYAIVGFSELDSNLIPFIVDVSGSLGKKALSFIDLLNSFASQKVTNFKSIVLSRLSTILAIGLAKTIVSYNNIFETSNSFAP
jgi:hypothetical protein